MFCGASSFKNIDHGDEPPPPAPPTSPKGSKKKAHKNNPFSSRGLDKYSTVLGELEARRSKIVEKAGGPQGVSVVKFSYSDSSDWIPVVVRRKDPKADIELDKISTGPKPAIPDPEGVEEVAMPPSPPHPVPVAAVEEGGARAEESGWGIEEVMGWVRRNWRSSYYWPLVGMLILFCVVVFGRVFAVCCLLIWWYLGPTVHSEGGGWLRSKKGYGRRLSTKKKGGLQR